MDLAALGLRPLEELTAAEAEAFEGANACSPPPPPPPLPEGWQEAMVLATGRRYYLHTASRRTAWEVPTSSPIAHGITSREAEAGVLKAGRGAPSGSISLGIISLEAEAEAAGAALRWEQVIDPHSGRAFYQQHVTGMRTWSRTEGEGIEGIEGIGGIGGIGGIEGIEAVEGIEAIGAVEGIEGIEAIGQTRRLRFRNHKTRQLGPLFPPKLAP